MKTVNKKGWQVEISIQTTNLIRINISSSSKNARNKEQYGQRHEIAMDITLNPALNVQ